MIATGDASRNQQRRSARRRGTPVLLTVALAFLMLLSGTPAFASNQWPDNDPRFAARDAVFERISTAASLGNFTSQGQVVAAGHGVFHSLAVQSAAPPWHVVYQRSTDGGRTWDHKRRITKDAVTSELLGTGDIAVSGDHVAIAYLGAARSSDPGFDWASAVFLIESRDAGATWSLPRQIGAGTSTRAQVAIDGERTWVAYDVMNVQTRVWSNQGAEVHTCGGDPQIAAEGGVVAVTAICDETLTAAVGQSDDLGAFKPVVTKTDGYSMVVNGVAVADGTAHILVSNLHLDETGSNVAVGVWKSSPDGSFDETPIYQELVPTWKGDDGIELFRGSDSTARIAAGRGTVAVTVVHADNEVQLYTSADQGRSFAGPTLVAAGRAEQDFAAAVAVAVPEPEAAQPRFSWKIDPHYVDTDGDENAEPANITGDAGADSVRVGGNKDLAVHLDACGSLPPATGTIASYAWKIGDDEHAPSVDCATDIELRSGQTRRVRLTVTMADGTKAATEQDVTPRDLVIASLGDGWASGDGNPNRVHATSPAWDDSACHRSAIAGPAQAAERIEKADDHTSVTFIQLACTGAALLDTTDDPTSAPGSTDNMNDGGILDAYAGGDPDLRRSRPSQLDDLATVLGSRHLDAVMISAGAGDIRLRKLMDECATNQPFGYCQNSTVAKQVPARLAQLPGRFDQVASRLDAVGGGEASVFLTEYADPTRDEHNIAQLMCPGGGVSTWTEDEAEHLSNTVLPALNGKLAAIAADHDWTWVDGQSAQFVRHGYCSDESWVVTAPESEDDQGDSTGTYLPNHAGQAAYAAALGEALAQQFHPAPVWNLDPNDTTDPIASGDITVVYHDGHDAFSVPFASTGEAPAAGEARAIESVTATEDASGQIIGVAAVMDSHASVAAVTDHAWYPWNPADTDDGRDQNSTPQVTVMQTAVRPNLGITDVRAVQAPDDATTLVAGRNTMIAVELSASLARDDTAELTLTVDALDTSGGTGRTLIDHETVPVFVKPGTQTFLVPGQEFTLEPGERVRATVTVKDPPGAKPIDDADNSFTLEPTSFQDTAESRQLRVDFAPVQGPGLGQTPSCGFVSDVAADYVDFANQVMPVSSDGIQPYLSCDPFTAPEDAEDPLDALLFQLDSTARESALDAVVGIIDGQWLEELAGENVGGIASIGGRAILISTKRLDPEILAHELGHNLGLDHTDGQVAAHGWRIDTRDERGGIDWMDVETHPKTWTSGATWDELVHRIGGPSAAPDPLIPTLDGRWVRGYIDPDGNTTVGAMLNDTGSATAPPEGSDANRLKMFPIDEDGNVIQPPIEIGLSPVDTAGSTAGTTGAFTFAQRVVPPAGAVALRFDLDGDTVATKQLGTSPAVAVTAPTAGAETGRGEQLNVAWTITDPDSDEFDTNLLVSDDDGAHWRPLSDDITHNATSASITVPADLGGDRVRIRVVVTDGSNTTWADSGAIKVGAGNLVERVAFVSDLAIRPEYMSRIGTMNPDGSDAKLLNLPAAKYGAPTWDPATGRLFMLGNNQCEVMSVNADGSGLRTEDLVHDYFDNRCGNSTNDYPDTSLGTGGCLAFSARGQRLMVDRQVFTRDASGDHWRYSGQAGDSAGWNTLNVATGSAPPGTSTFVPRSDTHLNVDWANSPVACSALSPDGKRSVTPVITYGSAADPGGASYSAVGLNVALDQDVTQGSNTKYLVPFDPATVAPYDGEDGMIVQETPPGSIGVTWLDDQHILVVQGSPEWDQAKLTKVDVDTGVRTDLGSASIASQTHALSSRDISEAIQGRGGAERWPDPYGTPKLAPDGTTLYGDSVDGTSCVGSMYTLAQTGGTAAVVTPDRTDTPPPPPPSPQQGIKGKAFAATYATAYPVSDGQVSGDPLDALTIAAGDSYSMELPEGDYLIRWGDPDSGRTWHDGSRWGTTDQTKALMVGVVHVGRSTWVDGLDYGNPSLPTTVDVPRTTVSGTITYQGEPVNGGQVELLGDSEQTTWTGPDGHFEFEDVLPGRYLLRAWGTTGGVSAFYGPAPTAATATPIVIDRNGTPATADVDIPATFPALAGGQQGADGQPFSSQIVLLDADSKKELTRVNVAGTWSLPVAPGRYLLAWDQSGSLYYWTGRSQGGTTSRYNATPIVVSDRDVTGLRFPDTSLPETDPGPFITGVGGHVYDDAGNPLGGSRVYVRSYTSVPGNYGEVVFGATTRADGSWSAPLDPGEYRVEFGDNGPFWNGTTRWNFTLNDAKKFTVADGDFVDDVDHGNPDLPVARPSSGTSPVDTHALCQTGFAWGLTKAAGNNEPPLVIDPTDAEPDIDNRPDREDPVLTIDPPEPDTDPETETAVPSLHDQSFTVPAGVPSEIVLKTGAGSTMPLRISGAPNALHIVGATPSFDTDGNEIWTTGPNGILRLIAAAGEYVLDVAVPGVPGLTAKVRLHVVAPPTPTALADTVTTAIGVDHTLSVADLLGNDRASDGGPLHLVSVGGYSAGSAYLDGDTVHVRANAAGGTFHYFVAEGDSPAYATGTVTVRAATSTQHYSVRFAANGGAGSMTDQTFAFDEAQRLLGNRFTRPGYRFAGWNTLQSGTGTSYRDGQQVSHLSTVDQGIVTLWAQWTKTTAPASPDTNGSPEETPGILPSTGGPDLWLLVSALLAIGAGVALLFTGRRRRPKNGD